MVSSLVSREISIPWNAGTTTEPSPWKQIRAKPGSSANRNRTTGAGMSYKIVATKEDQAMRSVRQSLLIAAAKARVWASEGWEVVVTDAEERTLDPGDFEKLFELNR